MADPIGGSGGIGPRPEAGSLSAIVVPSTMDDDAVRCWLVERHLNDKGLLVVTYATADGTKQLVTRRAATANAPVTAAVDVEPERLRPVEDPDDRERYAGEVERMAGRHDPDEPV